MVEGLARVLGNALVVIGLFVVIGLLLAALQGAASADVVVDRTQRFQLTPPTGWTAMPTSDQGSLYRMHSPDRKRWLVVTRTSYPNPKAWRQSKDFFATVERGLSSTAKNYKRLSRRRRRIRRVPVLDLTFERTQRGHTEVVAMRFLFFRRYTLTLALSGPKDRRRRRQRATQRVVRSFRPYLFRR